MTDWSGGGGYGGPRPVGPGAGPNSAQPSADPHAGRWQPGGPSSGLPAPWPPAAPGPTPGGYAGPVPAYAPGGPPAPGGPRPWADRNRRPLLITIGAGAAVLVVIIIVLVITLAGNGNGNGGGTAADAVKGYLEALSRGDAQSALTYSNDQPASKDFLTDDVLKKQIAKWPVSNIRILNDDSTGSGIGFAQVHVAANFGDKVSDITLSVKRNNKRWYLDAAAIKLQASISPVSDAASQTLTLFGKPLKGDTYVFPGYMDIASSNPYLDVKSKPMLLESLNSTGAWVQGEYSLNEAGTKAVHDALGAAFAACQNSTALKPPPPCPLPGLNSSRYVEGTAHWGPPDLGNVQITAFDQFHLTVMFLGEASVPVTVQETDGRHGDGTSRLYLNGTADLSTTPPTLTYH